MVLGVEVEFRSILELSQQMPLLPSMQRAVTPSRTGPLVDDVTSDRGRETLVCCLLPFYLLGPWALSWESSTNIAAVPGRV